MQLTIPLNPKVDARASSSFTKEQVEARIALLETITLNGELTLSAKREIEFLRGVIEKMK